MVFLDKHKGGMMSETLQEYDARTRLTTVKVDLDTWSRIKDSYPLKLCKKCQAWHPASTLEDFLCSTCRPKDTMDEEWLTRRVAELKPIVDTADMHEQGGFEDTQSLSAPEGL